MTATPINNSVFDLYRMISLFTGENDAHFKHIGIHSLKGHFLTMRRDLNRLMFDESEDFDGDVQLGLSREEANDRLKSDELIRALIVQRSRSFVRASMEHSDRKILFPETPTPRVVNYNLQKVYGALLEQFEKAFSRDEPLFKLSIYYPFKHLNVSEADFEDYDMKEGRLAGIVRLIRSGILKRFESSYMAFKVSCHNLLLKNVAWLDKYGRVKGFERQLDEWLDTNQNHIRHAMEINPLIENDDSEHGDYLHDIPDLNLTDWANEGPFNVEGIIVDAFDDLDQIVQFLSLMDGITPDSDDKLRQLVELLDSDQMAFNKKVIIFSEYMTTTLYLEQQLKKVLPHMRVHELHGGKNSDRTKIVQRFSPFYNNSSPEEILAMGEDEIDILVTTDVLAEGLNLQDSVRLINYDIHWNPVRLMQRIGRIDRRMDAEIEEKMILYNPSYLSDRGNICYWNFLPPGQLDNLLGLFERVSGKYLQISKLLGIEGGYGLTDNQELDHMKDFNELYQGKRTAEENLQLKYQELCKVYPEYRDQWSSIPSRTFSGKFGQKRYVFFCYSIPGYQIIPNQKEEKRVWSHDEGEQRWYLYDLESNEIIHETSEIMYIQSVIETSPNEPRKINLSQDMLISARRNVESHIFRSIMKELRMPVGVAPVLTCWMSVG